VLFQVLDVKSECVGYYANSAITTNELPPVSGETWDNSPHLTGDYYELARLYASGATLTDVCPAELKDTWETIKKTLRGCVKAFKTSHVSLDENCFYDLVPQYFLYEYLQTKNMIYV